MVTTQARTANKVELLKAAKDGLDALPDILRYAADLTPVDEIPDADLQRMKWYGLFHRRVTPGLFMLRLRVTGGQLTSEQARALVGIARGLGHESIDFTTRQNVQMRGITLPQAPAIFERLAACGLTSLQTGLDNVRNYVGCPLAGIDGAEVLDTTELLMALAREQLGNREYSNLPRKFNLSLAGCREDCGQAQTQDLGFLPATNVVEGRRVDGFNVLVGGALGGTSPRLATPLDVFVQPHDVVAFFAALLRVYRDHGPREVRTKARLKWLLAEWGEERLRAAVEREMGQRLLRAGDDESLRVGGDHLGVHPQRQAGFSYVGLHVPVGRITAQQLGALAEIAERFGAGELRLTVGQNVIVPHVPDERVDALLREPLLRELRPDPPAVWRGLVACTGNDYCHYSLIDTKTRAVELAAELERRGMEARPGTRIHISGCVHACGKHHIADIGLQGANVRVEGRVREAADVFAGGRLGSRARLANEVAPKVAVSDLADVVAGLLADRPGPALQEVPAW